MRLRTTCVAICALIALCGCQATRNAADLASKVASPNPVSGKRLFNTVSEEAEISQATAAMTHDLNTHAGGVDSDPIFIARLRAILTRISEVAHRQDLPWEIHTLDDQQPNAWTYGGGKILWCTGMKELANSNSDEEIAAVVAHEMAHCACRHPATKVSWASIQAATKGGKMYKACFTTQQEEEADRVSLIYLALAGFDSMAAHRIWLRATQKGGNQAKDWNYLQDHPLNAERAENCKSMAEEAKVYFQGVGVQDPNWQDVLRSNSLFKYREDTGNGWVQLIEGASDSYVKHLEAKTEETKRKTEILKDKTEQIRQSVSQAQVTVTMPCSGCGKVFIAMRAPVVSCPYCRRSNAVP